MGRIKTTFIKRKTKELYQLHGNKFVNDFNQNKEITNKYIKVSSKKIRNVIAGYITRLKKQEK